MFERAETLKRILNNLNQKLSFVEEDIAILELEVDNSEELRILREERSNLLYLIKLAS